MARILFINNSGAGFADYVDVAEGTTIKAFLQEKVHGSKPDDLLIRVNRQPVAQDYILQPNDRVSATPVKIEGAWRRR
jgi:sulfur carrier protein ThiS